MCCMLSQTSDTRSAAVLPIRSHFLAPGWHVQDALRLEGQGDGAKERWNWRLKRPGKACPVLLSSSTAPPVASGFLRARDLDYQRPPRSASRRPQPRSCRKRPLRILSLRPNAFHKRSLAWHRRKPWGSSVEGCKMLWAVCMSCLI